MHEIIPRKKAIINLKSCREIKAFDKHDKGIPNAVLKTKLSSMIDHTFQGRIQDFQIEGAKDFVHAAHIPSAKREVPYGRIPGTASKGHESSRCLYALTYYLSLILKQFGPYFEVLWYRIRFPPPPFFRRSKFIGGARLLLPAWIRHWVAYFGSKVLLCRWRIFKQ